MKDAVERENKVDGFSSSRSRGFQPASHSPGSIAHLAASIHLIVGKSKTGCL